MQTFTEFVRNKSLHKKLLEKIGKYSIYTVNAEAIRDTSVSDDEFNHFATHLEFDDLVPNNEVWISQDISKHERQFLIHNGLHQYEAKHQGKKDWYDYALRLEKAERKKSDGIKFNPKKKPPQNLYGRRYCQIGDVTAWLINGEIARDLYKVDFILGGNGGSGPYPWIPKNEIWIEKNLPPKEIPYVILHEYVENTLMMEKGLTYDKAHGIASKVEFHHRNHKFDKADVEALTRPKALEMAGNIC